MLDLTYDQYRITLEISKFCPSLEMRHLFPLTRHYIKTRSGKLDSPTEELLNLISWLKSNKPIFSVNSGSWFDILTKSDYLHVIDWIEGEFGK